MRLQLEAFIAPRWLLLILAGYNSERLQFIVVKVSITGIKPQQIISATVIVISVIYYFRQHIACYRLYTPMWFKTAKLSLLRTNL